MKYKKAHCCQFISCWRKKGESLYGQVITGQCTLYIGEVIGSARDVDAI